MQLSVIQGLDEYYLQWGCCTVLRGNSDSTYLVTYPVLITVRIYRLIPLPEDFWVGSLTVKQTEKHLCVLTAQVLHINWQYSCSLIGNGA